jgi:hypothetical protein
MLDIVLCGTHASILKCNNIGAFYLHQRGWEHVFPYLEHVLQGDMVGVFIIFHEVGSSK